MTRVALDEFETVTRVRVQWVGRANAGGESDFSFVLPAADDDPQQTVWLAFEIVLLPLFLAQRANSFYVYKIIMQDIWPRTKPDLIKDAGWGPIPPDLGPGGPPQMSPLISWRTGETGRNNRGRTFMGPYSIESYEDEYVLDPALSAVYDFAEAMIANFTGSVTPGNPLFAIISHWDDGVPIYPGAYSPVTNYFFQGRWATVRRRLHWEWRT